MHYIVKSVFMTSDASGLVGGRPGDVIEIHNENTANRLITLGFIEKPKKTTARKKPNNNEVKK